jgi:acetyl-CoA acetyltransferase
VIESNEAFAAQACAVNKGLGLDPAKVNPNGGAIALGHPVGATGAIITVKALYELERIGGKRGADHHVHRRRSGHRAGHRTGLPLPVRGDQRHRPRRQL